MAMQTESRDAKKLHAERAHSYASVEEQHRKYIDPKSERIWSHFVENRRCPVCDSEKSLHVLDKRGGTYVKCSECTMVYTNPVATDEALKKYYGELDTKQGEIVQNESPFYKEIYSMGLAAIGRFKKSGALLDIGCSTGFFLDIARAQKWDTYGVEPGAIEAEECRKKGHTLFVDTLENIQFDRTFSAITLWDVFEHIPHGKRCLDLLGNIIEPGGIVFMQIPNSDALAARMMRERCNMFDGLEHTNLYNPQTIKLITEARGFKIVEMKSVISEIAVMNNYLSYEDPYFGESRYDTVAGLLGLLDDAFIHTNLLGYKLQVVLQRK